MNGEANYLAHHSDNSLYLCSSYWNEGQIQLRTQDYLFCANICPQFMLIVLWKSLFLSLWFQGITKRAVSFTTRNNNTSKSIANVIRFSLKCRNIYLWPEGWGRYSICVWMFDFATCVKVLCGCEFKTVCALIVALRLNATCSCHALLSMNVVIFNTVTFLITEKCQFKWFSGMEKYFSGQKTTPDFPCYSQKCIFKKDHDIDWKKINKNQLLLFCPVFDYSLYHSI